MGRIIVLGFLTAYLTGDGSYIFSSLDTVMNMDVLTWMGIASLPTIGGVVKSLIWKWR